MKRIRNLRQIAEATWIILASKPGDYSYLTVDWLARRLGVSAPSLSRSFKSYYGFNIQQLLTEVKMIKAKLLLVRNEDMTVALAAAAVDYNSTSQFIRAFKKYMGSTPGEACYIFEITGVRGKKNIENLTSKDITDAIIKGLDHLKGEIIKILG